MSSRDIEDIRKLHYELRRNRGSGSRVPGKPGGVPREGGRRDQSRGRSSEFVLERAGPPQGTELRRSGIAVTAPDGRESAFSRALGLPAQPPEPGSLREAVVKTVVRLADHVGYYLKSAESSKRRVDLLEDKVADANFYISEAELRASGAEEELAVSRKEAADLRQSVVRSAIRMGQAGEALANMRKKKDEAFVVSHEETVRTQRDCEARIDRYKDDMRRYQAECRQEVRDVNNHLKWTKEGLDRARAEARWLREELLLSEEARKSAVEEAQMLRELMGGESERLKVAFSWAQGRYTAERVKSAFIQAELERAKATICGLRQSQGIEAVDHQGTEEVESEAEDVGPYSD